MNEIYFEQATVDSTKIIQVFYEYEILFIVKHEKFFHIFFESDWEWKMRVQTMRSLRSQWEAVRICCVCEWSTVSSTNNVDFMKFNIEINYLSFALFYLSDYYLIPLFTFSYSFYP